MRARFTLVTVALLALTLAGGLVARSANPVPLDDPGPAPGEPSLREMRQATERLRDVRVALAEGYIRDPNDVCETADMMGRPVTDGAMGIHYFRPDLLGITAPPSPRVDGVGMHTDFRRPAILLYEPQADGSLTLVGVENLVFAAAWRAAGHTERRTSHGVPFDAMADAPPPARDEAHLFAPHFDRHVWIYRDNPSGVFSPFNPAVSCAAHRSPGHATHGSPR